MRLIAVEMLWWYDGGIDHFWGIGEDGNTYLAMHKHTAKKGEGEYWVAQAVDPDLLERSIRGENVSVSEIEWDARDSQWYSFKGWANTYPADEFEMTECEYPWNHEMVEPDPDRKSKMTFAKMVGDVPDFYNKMQMPEYQCVDGVDPLLKTGDDEPSVCSIAP